MLTLGFLAFVGCGDDASENREQDVESPSGAGRVEARARCEVGSRPDYHVPANTQLLVIGCAELPVSGKPVEFSANAQRFVPAPADRREGERPERLLCINPAYRREGLGEFIPSICPTDPVSERLDILSSAVPHQASVRGYERVIWGTAAPLADEVIAIFRNGEEQAAVFNADKALADDLGAEKPFGVFVVELPTESGCKRVIVRETAGLVGRSATVERRPRCVSADN